MGYDWREESRFKETVVILVLFILLVIVSDHFLTKEAASKGLLSFGLDPSYLLILVTDDRTRGIVSGSAAIFHKEEVGS